MQRKPSAIASLRILYFAMVAGMLTMGGVLWFVSQDLDVFVDAELHRTVLLMVLFTAVGCLVVAKYLFNKDLLAILEMNDISSKFTSYRSAVIKRYAFTEAPFFFAMIAYFITHDEKSLVAAAILLATFISLFPSSARVASHLHESPEDVDQLKV